MERDTRLCAIASLILFPLHNQAVGGRRMNAHSDNILIQWNSAGGLEKPLPAMADITVFADGRVEVGPRFAHGTVTRHQLSEADLAALRRFVFDEQDIWSIDSAALDCAVKVVARAGTNSGSRAEPVQSLGPDAVADAATTVIRVSDGERTHQISHYNLFDAARRYPQINELQRLRAIERRLLELAQQVGASAR
jgi:hypothetical protein